MVLMPKTLTNITGLILAGGLGRRMNGQDKGLIHYQERPLIEHLLQHFIPQVSDCIISANRNISRYQNYGYPVYKDEIGDYAGPLAGIATALKHCDTEWLACVPCDAYSIPTHLVSQLYQTAKTEQRFLCIADDGQRLQPLYMVLHRSLYASISSYLYGNQQRVMQWVHSENTAIAHCASDYHLFNNINSL